ncbi:phage portal protein [Amylibacter sp. IMCC11727]|uniref:phage portal protein n=1 Tax=Amylibacter sp. IMCC11727 TaxID=3039851 RepID=UPI00244DF2C7|nr:phage portal protein [Amylibacter sp. IMCC11727]WGI20842.1 phage portal protein [Amylibacter sp. IMCC11727]
MVLQFLRGASQKDVPEEKASATGPVIAFHGAGRPAWSARDVSSLTRSGFLANPVGFRCVKMIAEAAAAVPLVLQNAEKRYDTHPMLALLAQPNPLQSRADLMESFFGQFLLSGDGYLEAAGVRSVGGPEELYVLRSDRMKVVPGTDGWPIAYEYSVGARKVRFDMQGDLAPICHVRSFHPQDDHYGLSPIQAAATSLDVHNAACRWSKALLDNAARPSGAIVYKGVDGQGTLQSDQYNRLVDEIEANHQGARNAGRPMLLEGGLDWKPMGFSPSDMEFQKTKESAAREVALAFGVPPMLLGLPGDATYANYAEANRAFYRLTVLPLVEKLAAALTGWLPDHFDEQLTLTADLDGIPALAIEREAQWRRVAQADFLSDREKRRLLGLPTEMDE